MQEPIARNNDPEEALAEAILRAWEALDAAEERLRYFTAETCPAPYQVAELRRMAKLKDDRYE
jgi:hypothetical protein